MIYVGRYHNSSGRIQQCSCEAIVGSGDVHCIKGFNKLFVNELLSELNNYQLPMYS